MGHQDTPVFTEVTPPSFADNSHLIPKRIMPTNLSGLLLLEALHMQHLVQVYPTIETATP